MAVPGVYVRELAGTATGDTFPDLGHPRGQDKEAARRAALFNDGLAGGEDDGLGDPRELLPLLGKEVEESPRSDLGPDFVSP